ncbi:hypothetical protein CRI64_17250 [Escherichia sp. E2748]|nr:hypothetical protein D9738_09555 [Escherichia sp. E10V5]TBR63950.1 hypothetical protein D9737_21120 [Escherichia sp. E10V4]TGB68804.1 hypothetical protein CQB02_03660 [Escherichia coli]TGB80557.1 hypothetical protein CRI66_00700 [Escherichia sp. E4694]TGB91812.1 hypothetical protein CRI64_17250 [Escherichia sp. E2748]
MYLYSFSNWWHLFKCYLNCFFRVRSYFNLLSSVLTNVSKINRIQPMLLDGIDNNLNEQTDSGKTGYGG